MRIAGGVPTPEALIIASGLLALASVTVMVADAGFSSVGVNTTVKLVYSFGLSSSLVPVCTTAKVGLLVMMLAMVTSLVPLFLIVTACGSEGEPTGTMPKLSVSGDTVTLGATPVPLSGT